jgi:hypothetical protein
MRYGIRSGGLESFTKGMCNLARIVGDKKSPCMADYALKDEDEAHARAIAESLAEEVILLGDESGIIEHYCAGRAAKTYPHNGHNIIVVPKRGIIYEDEVLSDDSTYVHSLKDLFVLGDTSFIRAVCLSTETARAHVRWFLSALCAYHENMTDINFKAVLLQCYEGHKSIRQVLDSALRLS